MSNPEPCGRPANWILIGDVEEGGAGFRATCRECYKRTYELFPSSADNLVPAAVFKDSFPRAPMCGDSEKSHDLEEAIASSTEHEAKDPVTYASFARWHMGHAIVAHAHRIAIDRRFDRLESWAARLTAAVSLAGALYLANWVSRTLHREAHDWVWYGVFLCVAFVAARWIHLGRFRKYPRVR